MLTFISCCSQGGEELSGAGPQGVGGRELPVGDRGAGRAGQRGVKRPIGASCAAGLRDAAAA